MSKGLFFALFAAFISGFSIFLNKILIVKGIQPLPLNIIKNSIALLIISITLLKLNKSKFPLNSQIWRNLIIIGILGGGIPFILFFEGLKMIPAINAALIHKTLFIWVGIFAFLFLKEKISQFQLIGYLLIFGSNFLINDSKNIGFESGEILILTATILWSLENILSKTVIAKTGSLIICWSRMFFGLILLFVFSLMTNQTSAIFTLNINQLTVLFVSGVMLAFFVMSFYKSLEYLPVSLSTAILVLSTVITNMLTTVFITRQFPINESVFNIFNISIVFMIYWIFKSKQYKVI
jgi:drug/metabolite transporter (DMT)-like permease